MSLRLPARQMSLQVTRTPFSTLFNLGDISIADSENVQMEQINVMKTKCIELRDYVLGKKPTLTQAPEILSK